MGIKFFNSDENDEVYKSWLFSQLESVPSFFYRDDIVFIDGSDNAEEFLVRNKSLIDYVSINEAIEKSWDILSELRYSKLNILNKKCRRLKSSYLNYVNFLSYSIILNGDSASVDNSARNKALDFLIRNTSEHNLNGIEVKCGVEEYVSLSSLNISYARIYNLTARDRIISSPYLKKSSLKDCFFNNSSIFSGEFEFSSFFNDDFENSSFLFSHFADTLVKNCKFIMANFECTSFFYCNIVNCDFSFSGFKSADFRNCNISKSNFSNANLTGADFSYTSLHGINFTGANLTGADFHYAALHGVDFTGANLDDVGFTGVSVDDKTILP